MDKISRKRNEQSGFEKKSRNKYVAMPILDKICKKLGTDYGEIMEYVPDKEESMGDK